MLKWVFSFLLLGVLGCKETPKRFSNLGVINLQVSGSNHAQITFEKGLLLLHSFEYSDAREAFQEARALDPEMPMAYWGEAMTHNHPLWSEQDYEDGVAVLAKLDEFDYKSKSSPLEQDLLAGVKILYKAKTEKKDRDLEYAAHMAELHEKYPKSQEVAAFYALSLLATAVSERDVATFEKGAKIVEGVLAENPNHPGALHYLIHSYDDPSHANLALSAAYSYSQVAPDASHALHMPYHIFVAMGMWDDVIASNLDSYRASLNRMEAKDLSNNARGYHAFHWLQYGYLQTNQNKKAEEMTWQMKQYSEETPSIRARTHMVFLKGTYLAETGLWDDPIADIEVDLKDMNITVQSQYQTLEGMKAYHAQDAVALDRIIKFKEGELQRGKFLATNGPAKLCSGVSRSDVTHGDLAEVEVRIKQLQALQADLAGDSEKADALFKEAVTQEEALSYSYGPPNIQKPSYELYANWLLAQSRMEEANLYYGKALKRGPKRRIPTLGMERTQGQP